MKIVAGFTIIAFVFVSIATTVISLGAYCLTSDGGNTRALRAFWEKDGTDRGQSSLAVYEVVQGKVRQVWYFPSEP